MPVAGPLSCAAAARGDRELVTRPIYTPNQVGVQATEGIAERDYWGADEVVKRLAAAHQFLHHRLGRQRGEIRMGAGVGTDFEAGVDPGLELSLIHQGFTAAQLFGIPCVVRTDAFADDEAGGAESELAQNRGGG